MPSRMEKYYENDADVKSRTNRNKELYKTIYENSEYTNVEGISVIEKNEVIDFNKIKELIGERETKKEDHKIEIIEEKPLTEEKNYDIREVLTKAKDERPEEEKILNTQYNILKNINIDEIVDLKKYSDDGLKNMIDAITENSKLGKTGDLLDDLKSVNNTVVGNALNKLLEEEKEPEMDKTFFTSSMNLKKDDFEDLKDISENIKANNKLTKVLLFIMLVIIAASAMFLVYYFLK